MSTPIEPARPLAFPLADLRLALSALAGVPVIDPRRPVDEDGQTGDGEQAWIFGRPTTRRSIGIDEYRTNADTRPAALTSSVSGNRVQTISLRAEVIDRDLDPTDILERIRAMLRSVAGQLALDALGLSISSLEAISDLGEQKTVNGRLVLVAVMDLRLGWAMNAAAFDDTGNTIDTVDGGTQAPGTVSTIPGTVQPA